MFSLGMCLICVRGLLILENGSSLFFKDYILQMDFLKVSLAKRMPKLTILALVVIIVSQRLFRRERLAIFQLLTISILFSAPRVHFFQNGLNYA